jgi:acyl-CoA reductase-like NAD-dependent aldehyde dehydrogenase
VNREPVKRYDLFVHGQWRPPSSEAYATLLDPSTGETLAEVAQASPSDVDAAVASSLAGAGAWQRLGAPGRARILLRVASLLRDRAEWLAALESQDCGQSLGYARHVVGDVAARRFEYFAAAGEAIGGRTIPMAGHFDYTLREPLGVTAHITPWNGPLWVGTRSIVPALAAGNSVVLKPGEEALLTMLELAAICVEAGMPPGVFNVVPGNGADAGAPLVAHPDVAAVVFTGSLATGRRVMALASETVKPVVLELGGKSANIVFADADLERAADWAVRAIFWGAGQICVAGSRLLVEASIAKDFSRRVLKRAEGLRVGRAIDSPDMGPLISEPHMERVLSRIDEARAEGAHLLTGGARLTEASLAGGFFLAPTVFGEVAPDSALVTEEIFGPVLAVSTFRDEADAIDLANRSRYGLAAALWTSNISRAHAVAAALNAGSIYVNRYFSAGVEAPAGGYRLSGFGRLDGREALDEFTQIKNVTICLEE